MAILSPQRVCVFNGRVPLFAGLGSTRKALGVQSQQNVQENLWWKSFHYVFWWIWSLFHLMFEMPGWVALLTVWFSFTTAVSWTIWCIGILYPSSYSFAFKPPQHQWSLLQGKKNTLMNSFKKHKEGSISFLDSMPLVKTQNGHVLKCQWQGYIKTCVSKHNEMRESWGLAL